MRKGDTASSIIMWIGGILAGGIILVWYLQHLAPGQVTIARLDNDLERIHEQLSLACVSQTSSSSIPIKTQGEILVNDTVICISAKILGADEKRCLPTPCAVLPAQFAIDHGRIGVRKDLGVVSVNP